jgi:hypothetical protein
MGAEHLRAMDLATNPYPTCGVAQDAPGIPPVPGDTGAERHFWQIHTRACCVLDPACARSLADLHRLLQQAESGDAELDARIDATLNNRVFLRLASDRTYRWCARGSGFVETADTQSDWSRDLTAALNLVPTDFGFSLGHRDSVCWAWIQPDDGWQPGPTESAHDHPLGSGVVIANTTVIALASAAILLRIRWDSRSRR